MGNFDERRHLRKKCNTLIKNSAVKTSAVSFASGLGGNPAVMVAAGGADVAQYFGFAINLAQQIAYLFGEDDLFDGTELSESAQIRVMAIWVQCLEQPAPPRS